MRKIVITVAPTGGFLTKDKNPFVPTQPAEIAVDVADCYNAGASVVALHARRRDDLPTCDPDVYREINDAVRSRCDIVIGNSSGGGLDGDLLGDFRYGHWVADPEQRALAASAGAELCSVNAMTVLGNIDGRDVLMSTSRSQATDLLMRLRQHGVKAEWEVFNPAHLQQDVRALTGLADPGDRPWINLCFGLDGVFQGAVPFSSDMFEIMRRNLPANSEFSVCGQGRAQVPACVTSIISGGHVRVGLEDNQWSPTGEMKPNVWFVEWAVRLVELLGFTVATADEARFLLGIGGSQDQT